MADMVFYLVGQIAFGIWIMDMMAQVTERLMTGISFSRLILLFLLQVFHLIKQEIPRAIFPVALTTLMMIVGWITPLEPVLPLPA